MIWLALSAWIQRLTIGPCAHIDRRCLLLMAAKQALLTSSRALTVVPHMDEDSPGPERAPSDSAAAAPQLPVGMRILVTIMSAKNVARQRYDSRPIPPAPMEAERARGEFLAPCNGDVHMLAHYSFQQG